jgi:hypothetical protein
MSKDELFEMERIALMLHKVVLRVMGCNVPPLTEDDLNEVDDIIDTIRGLKETKTND